MLTAPHPLGVLPEGNALLEGAFPNIRRTSLGPLSVLSDALLLRILTHLPAPALIALSSTSVFLQALACDEDLWRALVLTTYGGATVFRTSWRHSFDASLPLTPPRVLRGVYSDVLFHKYRCSSAAISRLWLLRDSIPRIPAQSLSLAAFRETYEAFPGKPVVITGLCSSWAASTSWNPAALRARFASSSHTFSCGGYPFTLPAYLDYAAAVSGNCDQPLYLFDSAFRDTCPSLASDYTVPEYFAEDLFAHVPSRPAHAWFILGPAGSGSSFHVDPNATSAWNACVTGSKKWIMFPPGTVPPGVYPSEDGSDVTAPLSVVEWFVNFYDSVEEGDAYECVVGAGDVVFVPAGWWHAVVNLEWTAAVTQNYAPVQSFGRVAKWLKERPEQVSGREGGADFGEEFESCIRDARPGIGGKRKAAGGGLWDSLKVGKGGEGTFSFGVG